MKIEDGGGSGKLAKVNSRRRLDVSAANVSESAYIAAAEAETYIWTGSYSTNTGDEIMYIKNNSSSKLLVIDKVTVNSVNAGFFELFDVSGTAAGTIVTGKNTNLTSGNVADATSYGDASVTGLTIGDRIDLARTAANGRTDMKLNDVLILGQNNAIAVTYTGSTGLTDIIITGYFEVLEGL